MIRAYLIIIFLVGSLISALAQHPLIGTWEMVSIAGVNVDGEKFQLDSTTIRETKIITPTHYILIARDKEGEHWKFNRCYSGKTKIDGDKYYEIPVLSSLRIFENVTTDFNWKVEGNQFIQTGTITRPDGKKILLDRFEFRRSETPPVKDLKFEGTWQVDTNGAKSLLIITPTHWMAIEQENEKFSKAIGGIYQIKDNTADLQVLYGSESPTTLTAKLSGKSVLFDNLTYTKVN